MVMVIVTMRRFVVSIQTIIPTHLIIERGGLAAGANPLNKGFYKGFSKGFDEG